MWFKITDILFYIYRHIVIWITTVQTHNQDRIYRFIYIYKHISYTAVTLLQPLFKQLTQHKKNDHHT